MMIKMVAVQDPVAIGRHPQYCGTGTTESVVVTELGTKSLLFL